MIENTITDPRDGNTYRTVQIGAQCWLAENLKYLPSVCPATTTPDGSAFYYVYDYQGNSVDEAKATANYRNYGALYNWTAALESCPPGWHLPSDAEWSELTDFLIRSHRHLNAANVAYALKSCRQVGSPLGGGCDTAEHPRWERLSRPPVSGLAVLRRKLLDFVDGNSFGYGSDQFGFAALPAGRTVYGCFHRLGELGYWWSSTAADSSLRVWCRQMTLGGKVNCWDMSKYYGYSVRCVRD